MHKDESKRFHEVADRLWVEMKEARELGFKELETALLAICDILHAKGSGIRINVNERLR